MTLLQAFICWLILNEIAAIVFIEHAARRQ